jgi:hypothetical protein
MILKKTSILAISFALVFVATFSTYNNRVQAWAQLIPVGIEIAGSMYAAAVALLGGTTAIDTFDKNTSNDNIFESAPTHMFFGAVIKNEFREAMQKAYDTGSMIMDLSDTTVNTLSSSTFNKDFVSLYGLLTPKAYAAPVQYTNYYVDRSGCGGCEQNYRTMDGNSFYLKGIGLTASEMWVFNDGTVQFYNSTLTYHTMPNKIIYNSNLTIDQIMEHFGIEIRTENEIRTVPSTSGFNFGDAMVSTGSGQSSIVMPPLTSYTAKSSATGEKINYNWQTGVYTKPNGAVTTEPVTWIPPKPVVKVNPTTQVKEIGVTVPVAGEDVFIPSKEVTNTHNPYVPQVIPLQDFTVGSIPVGGIDVYYPDTPYVDLNIGYTPANTTQKGLDIVISPPIATADPATGRITPIADGVGTVTITSTSIPKVITFPITITGISTPTIPDTSIWDWLKNFFPNLLQMLKNLFIPSAISFAPITNIWATRFPAIQSITTALQSLTALNYEQTPPKFNFTISGQSYTFIDLSVVPPSWMNLARLFIRISIWSGFIFMVLREWRPRPHLG